MSEDLLSVQRAQFVEEVLARTLGKSLKWEDTADDKVFQANLSEFILRIGSFYDEEENDDYIKLELLNSEGRMVESILPNQLAVAKPVAMLFQLRNEARRIARKSDASLTEVIGVLKALGEKEKPRTATPQG